MLKKFTCLAIILAILMGFASVAGAYDSVPAEGLMGDANSDTSVNSSDSAFILRYLVGLEDLGYSQIVLADVDHSGNLSASDATAILRYLVGLVDDYETTAEKTTANGEYSFIAKRNRSTVTAYLGSDATINPFPQAMEGHPVTAIAKDAFKGSSVTEVYFLADPPEGLAEAGITAGATLYYPEPNADAWASAGLEGYTLTSYVPGVEVSFTVGNFESVYTGEKQGITATPSVSVEFTVTYTQDGVAVTPKNAGTYQYEITVTSTGYAATGENLKGDFVIEKATYAPQPTMSDKRCKQEKENELEQFNITAENIPDGVTVSYTYYYRKSDKDSYVKIEDQFGKDPGQYRVVAHFDGDYNNFYVITDKSAMLTITSDWGRGFMSLDDDR